MVCGWNFETLRCCLSLSETAIDFATVPYVADSNGRGGRIEFVDDAVITNPVAPGSFGAGQFKVRRNARRFGQLSNGLENVPDGRGREFSQVFLYRRFEQDIISRHDQPARRCFISASVTGDSSRRSATTARS